MAGMTDQPQGADSTPRPDPPPPEVAPSPLTAHRVEGEGRDRATLRLVQRATNARWPLTEETRRVAHDLALSVACDTKKGTRERLAALRALVAMDQVNVRREANDDTTTRADRQAALEAARLLLSTPQGQEALSQLTAAMCQAPQASPPSDGKLTSQDTTSDNT